MQYLSPPDSPTSELEVEEGGAPSAGERASGSGRKLTEAQEHYSKHHADWLPQPLKADLSIASSSPAAGVSAAPTTASARKSRFGLLVPASPAFVAGGSLHSTSTQNKAVLLPPTLSASPSPGSSTGASSSPSGGSSSLSSPAASSRGSATSPATGTAAAAGSTDAAAAAVGSPPGGGGQAASFPATTRSPLNIDSRTVLNAAAAAPKTRVLSTAGGLSGSGVVKTLENSATSAAAGALVAAAFGRGAAVTGSTPQSAKFAAAAAAAEAAARAAAAGRTEKGLPPDALVDGLPVQSFSHLRVMKEGTCVEVFCLPLLFQQARSTGRLILGRAEAADIPTEHPSCSRLHCELRRTPVAAQDSGDGSSGGGGATRSRSNRRFTYTLKDLGSGHGTLINGGRVAAGKDTVLEDEDEIQLGFSQRLYLFFTGKDTFGPDPPSPSKEEQSNKTPPPPRQAGLHQGPRGGSAAGADPCPPAPPAAVPAPPCTPPPPAPPMRPAGDEAAGVRQQQQGAGVGAGSAADPSLWRRPPEIEQNSDARWRTYQQHMEQLHQQRLTSLGGSPVPYCLPAASTDAEQAMLLQQQQHALFQQQQQQQDGYAEEVGSSGCSGMNAAAAVAAGSGGGGAGGWRWEAAQQQQLLYWQQQQQGLAAEAGWETGQQEQMWNAASLQEHAMQQYMAERYAQDQQCWDAAAVQQQQHCAGWSPQLQQQQQPSEESSYSFQQHQQRRSGWSPLSSQPGAAGEQQEEFQQCDGRQQQQQAQGRWHPNFAAEGRESSRGRGARDGRGAAGAAGGGGGPQFKRRPSSAAARKLLWQHAGKKQQGDETSAAAADDAATPEGSGNKRLRLDGAKVALWGRGHDGAAATAAAAAGGTREQPGAAAGTGEREGGGGGATAGLPAAAGSSSSGSVLRAASGAGSPQPSSPALTAAAAAASQPSWSCSSNISISGMNAERRDSAGEEGTAPRVFCAHILLSFVRRADVEPWQGSSSSNRSSGGVLLGRGGRVVTRSRSDALSSLKSVKDITAEDPTQFGEFAAELSDCPSSKKRGVLGWVHGGLPGGRPPTLQQQQQQTPGSSNNSKEKEQQHAPQRRTATEVAAQQSVEAASESSNSSSKNEDKQEEWWLPQEAVEAALQLQVGELSAVIESEHGAHLLLRLK